ncbi:Lipopolysaccharide biosynthesis protein RfbH, partial [Chlamydiales bacterium SCGC AG-110-P3]
QCVHDNDQESRYPLATSTWDNAEYRAAVSVLDSGHFTMGATVRDFEAAFAERFGSRYAVMVNSGSSANLLAVAALCYVKQAPLKRGDEVIVPAVSWSTTYYPWTQYGLTLRFVDVDADTLNLDVNKVADAITPNTREAMGACYDGSECGTFGRCGTFSTFFSHHICTMEGGLIITDDEALYQTMLSMRAHGWTRDLPAENGIENNRGDSFFDSYRFVLPGYNLRPTELQAAIGIEQLHKLDGFLAIRRRNAEYFLGTIGKIDGLRLQRSPGNSSWFGFSMILEEHLEGQRGRLVEHLTKAQIECRPIVAGNFVNNPVVAHLPHTVSGSLHVADTVDSNGLFVGNSQDDLRSCIDHLQDTLSDFFPMQSTF